MTKRAPVGAAVKAETPGYTDPGAVRKKPGGKREFIPPRRHPQMPPDGNPDDCPLCGYPHLRCRGHNSRGLPCRNFIKPGFNYCKSHGGATPSHKKHADSVKRELERSRLAQEAQQLRLGDMVEVDPTEEMLRQIFISAGTAEYYRQKVAALNDEEHIEIDDELRIYRCNLYIDMWNDERSRLFDFCKKAKEAGLEEAQFELAMSQARMVARVLDMAAIGIKVLLEQELGITSHAALSLEAKVREVMGEQLRLVSTNPVAIPVSNGSV